MIENTPNTRISCSLRFSYCWVVSIKKSYPLRTLFGGYNDHCQSYNNVISFTTKTPNFSNIVWSYNKTSDFLDNNFKIGDIINIMMCLVVYNPDGVKINLTNPIRLCQHC